MEKGPFCPSKQFFFGLILRIDLDSLEDENEGPDQKISARPMSAIIRNTESKLTKLELGDLKNQFN